VIVLDTSVLSLAFRRRSPKAAISPAVTVLQQWIADDEPLAIPGIVLQEILSGVRERKQMAELQRSLEGFPILLASRLHHVQAAKIVNSCCRKGIACSTVDALIAAQALECGGILFGSSAESVGEK
jgi:predicted nucleic acid-binding protein